MGGRDDQNSADLSLCVGAALLHRPRGAQDYPDRPIKMVVPFPAGGPTDGMARIVSDRLGTVLGQSIVIENSGGAQAAASAPSSPPPPNPTATPS